MVDIRVKKTAEILVDYSTEVKEGDKVLIVGDIAAKDLILEIYKLCLERGAYPKIKARLPGQNYIFYKYAKKHQLEHFPEEDYEEIKKTDVWFGIRAAENVKELMNVNPEKISLHFKTMKPILEWRVEKTRWVVFYYPTNAFAQEAGMSLEEFEDFVYNATLIDWKEMSEKMSKIKKLVDKTDEVRIIGEDTDLTFSVKGRNAVVADGKHNMPDGEVFTSVVEDSTNGYIYYEFPAIYYGNEVEGIRLKFKDGEVVEAKASKNEKFLKKMINTDEGAKRIGEFGIGLNYMIDRFVKNILFDEKIGGTIHLALGRGYKETLSKNDSAIHWDMIKDLRRNGKIYFDGELVFENGKWFILEE